MLISRPFCQLVTLSFWLIEVGTISASDSPEVTRVFPPPQTISAEVDAPIMITFSMAINPQTVDASTVMIFGHWSGVMPGEFRVEDNNKQVVFAHSQPFSAGELVTISVSKNVKGQDGQALNSGYAWNFWAKAGHGTLGLEEVARISVRNQGEGPVEPYGAYAGDLNGDGYTDLSVPNEFSQDVRVFLNDGMGTYGNFSIYPLPNGGARPSTNEGADFNGDGIIDFAVGNRDGNKVSVLVGRGDGGFLPEVAYSAGDRVNGLCVIDVESDGDVDIITANRLSDNLSILLNDGNALFAGPISFDTGGVRESTCAVADANNDGILDLFVGALLSGEIILLLGDGIGGFTYGTKTSAGGSPWMLAAGDLNGDANVDVVSATVSNSAIVLMGDGQGNLLPAVSYQVGEIPSAIDLGDLDGDGDLDMVVSNLVGGNWTIYENVGDGTFTNPRTLNASQAGSCAVLHDRDSDGDLDLTGIDEVDDLLVLFENSLVLGDINNDGTINIIDLIMVVKYVLSIGIPPTSEQFIRADINADGIIDVNDIIGIIHIILEL